MIKIFRNIITKSTALIAVFAVILLNFSSVVHCSSMLLDNDCCHTQNLVKPCCVKHVKITTGERITGNCGCTMKEVQQHPDLYADISFGQYTPNTQKLFYSEALNDIPYNLFNALINEYHSPPDLYLADIYLSNMNLRI